MALKHKLYALACLLLCTMMTACTISYRFNGASINYDLVHTISIDNFPIQSAYVYPPLGITFNEQLLDIYMQQTRLNVIDTGGDMDISGEIIEYSQRNKAVQADGLASMVTLTVRVNVRFVNNTNHSEDFEQQFSASADYDSTQQLIDVQDELISEIVDDLVDQIFNATVARW